MIGQPKRICIAILLAGFLASPQVYLGAVSRSRRAKAISTYSRAVRMRTTIASLPERKRTKANYANVIQTFQEVVRLNPTCTKAPAALAAVAELYEEMGRVLATDRYFLESIKTYQFLVTEYPRNRISRDALFTIAEIYRTDIEDPEKAREAFQQFLDKYPKSSKAEEAQVKIKEIDQLLAKRATSKQVPSQESAKRQRASGLPAVTDVRQWVGPNYSRIVIAVESDAKFETSRLSNPDRIVLDIQDTRLSPALVGRTFPVEDGFLRQVRVGQFRSNVTRVVLDVEKLEEYSVLPLPNPFRLVIDVRGTTAIGGEKDHTTKASTTSTVTTITGQKSEEKAAPPEPSTIASKMAKKPEVTMPSTEANAGEKAAAPQTTEETETALLKPTVAPPIPPGPEAKPSAETEKKETAVSPTPAAPTESGSRTLTRALGLKIGRIAIDPGHGGHDTGTIGPRGLREKDVVLDVALRLKKLLTSKAGYDVVMTRSDDTFIPLEERTAIANEKAADLFVSIHANASRDHSARGIETYYLNFTSSPDALEVAARENATSQESVHQLQDIIKKIAMTEKIHESGEFARLIQKEVHRQASELSGEQRDRGVKKAPFVVLIGANMPSILAEISFLTNPRDEKLLRRPDYRQHIAEALRDGILEYINNLGGVRTVQQTAQSPSESSPKF